MQRRKFIAGLGSLAAAGAAGIGTGAFSTVSADRSVNVSIAGDKSAYLGLDPSGSEYASINGGDMTLEFDGSNGQNGSGLNDNANTKFHNVFKVENNGTNPINVELRGLDAASDDGDGVDPIAMFYTYDELTSDDHNMAYSGYGDPERSDDLWQGSPNPLEGAGSWAPSGDWYMQLNSGDSAYVHIEFYLKDSADYPVDVKGSIPSEFSLYANGASSEFPSSE